MVWIPFWFNEFSYASEEIRSHLNMKKHTAKQYFSVCIALLIKLVYLLYFVVLFWKPSKIISMLNKIFSTSVIMEHYAAKSNSIGKYLLHLNILLMFMAHATIHIIWFVEYFIPDKFNLEQLSSKLCKVLIVQGRQRFQLQVFELCFHTSADYFIGVFEFWIENVSRLVWIITSMMYVHLVPATMWIIAKSFKDTFESFNLETCKVGSKGQLRILYLFETVKNMSNSINSVWANTCLIWILQVSAKYAFNLNSLYNRKILYIHEIGNTALKLLSWCVMLYTSGDVYRMVRVTFECIQKYIIKLVKS